MKEDKKLMKLVCGAYVQRHLLFRKLWEGTDTHGRAHWMKVLSEVREGIKLKRSCEKNTLRAKDQREFES
jgi:hypothetical protein